MKLASLEAISPIDGRYRKHVVSIARWCSEAGLIESRVDVEFKWLVFLIGELELGQSTDVATNIEKIAAETLKSLREQGANEVQLIEQQTNHDVKAVEYFVCQQLDANGLSSLRPYVHFGCTSEDINNLAYASMLANVRKHELVPAMCEIIECILSLADSNVDTPMLSRTHGQTASPTTLGKELVNVAARLTHWLERFSAVEITAKMNGAVGNFNAHSVAVPGIDWLDAARRFVYSLDFKVNPYTTQIEPHDWIAEYLHAIVGFNQVLLDFDRDIWAYISIGYFKQKQVAGEVGSSTMPHKVNPIDFENAEGNIGVGNVIAKHLAEKLLVSRWQRDLTDSTALRNVGTVFAHTVIAIRSTMRGIQKLEVDGERLSTDLNQAWEVLAEAVQTVMRRAGVADAYEQVKEATRGRRLDRSVYHEMLDSLTLADESRETLKQITPDTYIGLAPKLARAGIADIHDRLAAVKP
ncbi:MAG: adenylosuccinate lyase [Gammaproteobacteria bacterium]|nr:adenylosuccinate lyase [Gammaproteobacteria bacterium]